MKVIFALSVNAPWPEFVNRGGQIFALTDAEWCYRTLQRERAELWLASYFLIKDEGRYRPLMGMLSQSQNEKDAPK